MLHCCLPFLLVSYALLFTGSSISAIKPIAYVLPTLVMLAANQPGSCAGSCGVTSPGGCGCDDQCGNYNDCCADYNQQCRQQPSAVSSCVGRCGETKSRGASCFCDNMCKKNGDCCADYNRACKCTRSLSFCVYVLAYKLMRPIF